MSEDVIARVENGVGRLTLNRPSALHALTTGMCRTMTQALLSWRTDPRVALVLIDHAGERGFCAGGDIRMLAGSGESDGKEARAFFLTEYRLNHLLFSYTKPTLAVMDGITMGGGVGLSRPCRYRVATERTTFAMPETGIGLFPDVGGGWYLPRMPDQLGIWLALTGARIKAADCALTHVSTHTVSSENVFALKEEIIASPSAVEAILARAAMTPGTPSLSAHAMETARCFAHDTIEQIIEALDVEDTEWARAQLSTLATKSPQAMKVALRQCRLGAAAASFADNMAMEFRIATRVVMRDDFREGVRAVIVDKDNLPKWNPDSLEKVSAATIDEIFAPLPDGEEWTPLDWE